VLGVAIEIQSAYIEAPVGKNLGFNVGYSWYGPLVLGWPAVIQPAYIEALVRKVLGFNVGC
jgi:hypothetical protein